MEISNNKHIERMAERLHIWYLEATENIYEHNAYNIHAQVPYEDLTEVQKSIDRYIATRVYEFFEEGINEFYKKKYGGKLDGDPDQ